jgi:hypothetical protein
MPTDTHCIKDKGTKRRNEKKERKENTIKNNLPV